MLLISDDILREQIAAAWNAISVDVMSYGFGKHASRLIGRVPARIIFGVFTDIDRQKVRAYLHRLQVFTREFPMIGFKGEIRLLPESHVKLFIAHLPSQRPCVILSTTNLGTEGNIELGVRLKGDVAKQAINFFNTQWRHAEPITPLDVKDLATQLSSTTFGGTNGK